MPSAARWRGSSRSAAHETSNMFGGAERSEVEGVKRLRGPRTFEHARRESNAGRALRRFCFRCQALSEGVKRFLGPRNSEHAWRGSSAGRALLQFPFLRQPLTEGVESWPRPSTVPIPPPGADGKGQAVSLPTEDTHGRNRSQARGRPPNMAIAPMTMAVSRPKRSANAPYATAATERITIVVER